MAPNRSPETIEHEIEETRRQAEETVAALERKLSPRHIAGQVGDNLRQSSYFRSALRGIGDSPIGLLLIAAGLGLIAYTSVRQRRIDLEDRQSAYDDEVEQVLPGEPGDRFRHHRHVADSHPGAPVAPPPEPDRLLGRRKAGKSAEDSARVFR